MSTPASRSPHPEPAPRSPRVPVCLSVAGSDSGGGAGIQADLKAFARCGVHGTTAITALTAQNTVAVSRVLPVDPDMVVAQIEAVASDLGVDAVKIGMVGSARVIAAVAGALDALPAGTPVVLDPVMIAESGGRLLDADAEQALVELLLPRATVVTPNVPEAHVLAGHAGDGLDGERLARAVRAAGARAVVLTGGHRTEATDVLLDGDDVLEIPGVRHPDGAAHGSGCTHSSALAAHLALGFDLREAARAARAIAADAVGHGLRGLGHGAGPVNVLGSATATCTPWRAPGGSAALQPRPERGAPARGSPARAAAPDRARGAPSRGLRFAIITAVRFLRMKPGHGEVLLAEGDVSVLDDEQRLVQEFRRQLDEGMWAAVPTTAQGGRREARMVRAFEEIPRDAERVIFFPRAAGGR
ncbi:bifunctional hydroxymethylpyrimidine kinase/phosphomethylpyrimidine kinase [Baekduia soli]|uniref:bifunctional hydroxymethylpyrimidine kinase/phosphomethylpyrimidine kinase n=1 Tax=Baekduia soli TaxID=496014 RepID=UPI001E296C6A|nr:bifunctional hydroxymethylpyrimidine kinase/phosphomethylpyrimidine kinase [Baekduia soli]